MNQALRTICLATMLFSASAQFALAAPSKVETESYIVSRGDTLFSLATKHGVSMRELKKLNGLKRARLNVGQVLQIPVMEKEEVPAEDEVVSLLDGIENVAEAGDTSELSERVLGAAKEFLGIPYKFGGTTTKGIDCSAYVKRVFAALNIELPRTAREQFHVGEKIAKEELTPGDLVFFKTYSRRFASHVGIFLGDNKFIHASSKGKKVEISNLDAPYYAKRFIGAKRLNLNL